MKELVPLDKAMSLGDSEKGGGETRESSGRKNARISGTTGEPPNPNSEVKTQTSVRLVAWTLAGILVLASTAYLIQTHLQSINLVRQALLENLQDVYHALVPESLRLLASPYVPFVVGIFLSPLFYIAVAFICILERLFPVKRNQKFFSTGMFQDFFWFISDGILKIAIVAAYVSFLQHAYTEHLGLERYDLGGTWPPGVRVVIAIFLQDFLSWSHHFLRHKVQTFWLFHTIHHSQREMNLFTDIRVHAFEYLWALPISVLPMFALQLQPYTIIYLELFHIWYTRIYHANIRSNYGVLKHFMVTPQSHRIHHSIEKRHQDKNFGVMFTIWDRMFGTLHKNYEEYPETGVSEEGFPLEKEVKGLSVLKNYGKQLLYPFLALRSQTYRRDPSRATPNGQSAEKPPML